MTLQPFNYIPADTLQTAEALLREHGERAAVIAGGTDLLGALKDGVHDDPPELLIGLKPVTALRYVEATPAGYKEIVRAQVSGGKVWSAPILVNGKLYVRNSKGEVVCVDVKGTGPVG